MESSKWTLNEYNLVFNEYSRQGNQLVKQLPGRSPRTIYNKALNLGQNAPTPLTKIEQEFLNEHGKQLGKAASLFLYGHSPKEISSIITNNSSRSMWEQNGK